MRRLFLAGALLCAMLIPAASASAAPTGNFARFAQCPLSNAKVIACMHAETASGFFTIGNKTTPIKNKVILQTGMEGASPFDPNVKLVPAANGETLSKTPQPVPGGLLGITAPAWWPKFLRDLFNETINNGFTGVTGTVELAAPVSSIKVNVLGMAAGVGTGLSLPVKLKLSNPFLGSNCYIGSTSSPIVLNLTTGTTAPPPPNTPITGNPGEGAEIDPGLIAIQNNKLVNNSFAAPGANGCGGLFSFLIDPFVDSIVGTPSAAGKNTAVLEGTLSVGLRPLVEASDP
jgi:hypothetical protein